MLQADLKILGGKHQGKLIPLSTKKFLVGREQDCHLKPNSDLVSRHHCVFTIDDYAVRLRDLGSTNGTHVNGVPLRGEIGLQSGDRIKIGKLELELVVRQVTTATPAHPIPLVKLDGSAEMDTVPDGMTAEIPVYTGDSIPIQDTSFEVGTQPETAAVQTAAIQHPAQDTTIISGGTFPPGYAQPGAPGYPAMMPYGMPGYPQQGMPYPQQPMMPYPQQPMGYPQQYPMGYGQPMYPGYPGYAPGVPGYAPTEAATAVAEPVADKSAFPAVKLPPPEETGVKAPAPAPVAPAPVAGAAPAPAAPVEKPSTSAADIIKQYMQKRSR